MRLTRNLTLPVGGRLLIIRRSQRETVTEEGMTPRIPFNRPFIAGKELFYIAQAVTGGRIAGDGHFTKACAELMEREYGIAKVLMTPSCTAAMIFRSRISPRPRS